MIDWNEAEKTISAEIEFLKNNISLLLLLQLIIHQTIRMFQM